MHTKPISQSLKGNIYSALAHVYFFFNQLGLPFGLLYMQLLSPIFYFWLLFKKKKNILLPFVFIFMPYAIIHMFLGVDLKTFIISNVLLFTTYIFTITFSYFLGFYKHLGLIFKQLFISNFIFTIIALLFLFTPYREVFWYVKKFTKSVENLPRLALMTYEASYYSFMFVPLAFYYLLKVFFNQLQINKWTVLFMLLLPLLLSLSVGVLTASFISIAILYLLHFEKVFYNKYFFNNLILFIASLLIAIFVLYILYPQNPIFVRIQNILSGTDSSTNGRTSDSFLMAYRIACEKSIWFGVGLGQIKTIAPEIVHKYFRYWGELEVIRIPNAMAETLAIFGVTGVILRLGIIFYYFFKTKVLNNYYRTSLFFFVFIYQFTGSYITNIVEYVIWALAFSNVFTEFNVYPIKENLNNPIGDNNC